MPDPHTTTIYQPFQYPGAPKPKGRHGGRRPGAGAKPGNTNALKRGRYSPRFGAAMLLIAVVPELRDAFQSLLREDKAGARRRYLDVFAVAHQAVRQDPDLAETIKQLLLFRLRQAATQIPGKLTLIEILEKHSNDQDDLPAALQAALGPILSRLHAYNQTHDQQPP